MPAFCWDISRVFLVTVNPGSINTTNLEPIAWRLRRGWIKPPNITSVYTFWEAVSLTQGTDTPMSPSRDSACFPRLHAFTPMVDTQQACTLLACHSSPVYFHRSTGRLNTWIILAPAQTSRERTVLTHVWQTSCPAVSEGLTESTLPDLTLFRMACLHLHFQKM